MTRSARNSVTRLPPGDYLIAVSGSVEEATVGHLNRAVQIDVPPYRTREHSAPGAGKRTARVPASGVAQIGAFTKGLVSLVSRQLLSSASWKEIRLLFGCNTLSFPTALRCPGAPTEPLFVRLLTQSRCDQNDVSMCCVSSELACVGSRRDHDDIVAY